MKTKYLLCLSIGVVFLVGCNGDSNPKKNTKKSVNINFEYQRIYTQKGEINGIEMHVSRKKEKIEEIDKLSKKIDVDSCQIIDKSIIQTGDNSILDMGDILITAEWSNPPLTTLTYSNMTKNYNGFFIYGGDKRFTDYRSGDEVTFKGDSSKFTISGNALNPIKILSPKINNGEILNVDNTIPLKVIWSGGSSQNIVIYLTGIWTSLANEETETLACHVENDGEFIIPLDILEKFQWRQKTELTVVDRQTTMTENAKLIMGAFTNLDIYENKSATPSPPTKTMQEGYVENLCSTNEECGGGDCLNKIPFVDGYCSLKHCTSDSQCPNDANCFIEKGQSSIPQFCAKPCSVDSDCRTPYYHCRAGDNGNKSCVPAVF